MDGRDTGKVECRTGGCRKGGMQEWMDERKEGSRNVWMHELAGKEIFKRCGMQIWFRNGNNQKRQLDRNIVCSIDVTVLFCFAC